MNKEEFKEQLFKDLRKQFGNNYTVEYQQVNKAYTSYDGICIHGETIGVVINIDENYDEYVRNGSSMDSYFEVLSTSISAAKERISNIPNFNLDFVKDYDQTKDKLYPVVINLERNKEKLLKFPHYEIEDLALYFKVELSNKNGEQLSTPVTHELLKSWNIRLEKLYDDTMKAASKNNPVRIQSLGQMLGMKDSAPMYVVTNEKQLDGAAAMFYPESLERCSEVVGGNFIALPSSVHEFLVIPAEKVNTEELKAMVKQINHDVVDEKDQLSDNVYHYDAKTKEFETIDNYLERTNTYTLEDAPCNKDMDDMEMDI